MSVDVIIQAINLIITCLQTRLFRVACITFIKNMQYNLENYCVQRSQSKYINNILNLEEITKNTELTLKLYLLSLIALVT